MKIQIIVDGVERTFQGDYHELHNQDWSGRVRDLLDDVYELKREADEDYAYRNPQAYELI